MELGAGHRHQRGRGNARRHAGGPDTAPDNGESRRPGSGRFSVSDLVCSRAQLVFLPHSARQSVLALRNLPPCSVLAEVSSHCCYCCCFPALELVEVNISSFAQTCGLYIALSQASDIRIAAQALRRGRFASGHGYGQDYYPCIHAA